MTDSERPSEKAGTPVPNDQTDEHASEAGRSKGSGKRLFFDTKTQSIEDIANEFWDKTHETE
jgi:hypothetical protein